MKMKEDFVKSDRLHEKSIENDVSDTYKVNSQGETLWSLRSVVKLGIFMTKSELDSMNSKFQTRLLFGFENDVTDSISYTNRGMILLKKVLARK